MKKLSNKRFILDLSAKLEEIAVLQVFKENFLQRFAGDCHILKGRRIREGETHYKSSCTENPSKQLDKRHHLS